VQDQMGLFLKLNECMLCFVIRHLRYVGWSMIDSFYFVWYTASTVGYGDYGLFECVKPTRFPVPYLGSFDVARVNSNNTETIQGTCRTPDIDSFAKVLVVVVVAVAVGAMTLVIVTLQKLIVTFQDRVHYLHKYEELKNAMRRAAFKVLQVHFDELDDGGDGTYECFQIARFFSLSL
jgi:hypothetical protein